MHFVFPYDVTCIFFSEILMILRLTYLLRLQEEMWKTALMPITSHFCCVKKFSRQHH